MSLTVGVCYTLKEEEEKNRCYPPADLHMMNYSYVFKHFFEMLLNLFWVFGSVTSSEGPAHFQYAETDS